MTATEILREEVKQYVEHADDKSLRMALAILKIENGEDWGESEDWWDEMPDEVRELVNLSLKEAEEGGGISHEEMVKKHPQWFKK